MSPPLQNSVGAAPDGGISGLRSRTGLCDGVHSRIPVSHEVRNHRLRCSRVAEDHAFEALDPCGEVARATRLSGVAVLLDPLADQHARAYMLGGGAAPDPVQQRL